MFHFFLLRFLSAALLLGFWATGAGGQVVIHEVCSTQNDRLLQFPTGGLPKLGATPRWHDLAFAVPSWWRVGAGPFGFGGGYTQNTNLQSAMLNQTPSVYLRRSFTVTAAQAANTNLLELLIDYEDGFVAYLNGVEVARRNTGAVGSFAWHSQTAFNVKAAAGAETITLDAANTRLLSGTNVLAIQVHNNHAANESLRCDAILRIGGASPQTLVASTDPWSWFAGTHEPAGGLYESTDFTQPLQLGPDWTQPDYADAAWTLGAGALGYEAATTEYRPQLGTNLTSMQNAALSVYMRREFTMTTAQYAALTATSLTVDWDDGYVLYINGYEISRANIEGAAGSFVPYNTAASMHNGQYDNGGNDPGTVVSVAVPRNVLRAGRNVISAQLHNTQMDSTDLLLDVRFSGTSGGTPLTFVALGSPWRYHIPDSEFASPTPLTSGLLAPEFLDWIELKNTGTSAVDLGGWVLTDEEDTPSKWAFPAGTVINAGAYLVVACSGRNVTSPLSGGLLHTNFSLSSKGEYLALRDSGNVLRSELLGIPDQDSFHTWGLDPSSGQYRYHENATPGAANGTGNSTDITDEVDFDKPTGFHTGPLSLALTCATPGASIRYTLDGSEPSSTSTLYTGAFDPTSRPTPGPGAGTILREFFQWSNGTYISPDDFRTYYASTTPTISQLMTEFETPTGSGDYYTHRVRGYVHAPQTGNYEFYLATDDDGELWLSTNDQPANQARIAYVDGWVNPRNWFEQASQRSISIHLVAGQRYAIEALQSEGGGGDNLAVGWSGPGLPAGVNVIADRYLSPPDALPPGIMQLSAYATVRARAFVAGRLPGEVRTRNYVLGVDPRLTTARALFLSGPPTETFYSPNGIFSQVGGSWPNGWWSAGDARFDYNFCMVSGDAFERPMALEFIDPGNVVVERTKVGARFAGSPWSRPQYQLQNLETGSWNGWYHNKPQINLFFRSDFGIGRLKKNGFIPTSQLDEWDTLRVRAGKNDAYNPFIIDEWMRRSFAGMGAPSPQGFFATLFINGHFKSYFNPCERPRDSFFQEFYGSNNAWDVNVIGSWESGDATAYNEMDDFFRDTDFTPLTNYQQGAAYWDMTNAADYFILNAWGATQDWPHNNFTFARERTAGAKWLFSMWDAEGAMGVFGQSNLHNTFESELHVNSPNPISSEETTAALVFRRAYQNTEFRMLFADRLQKHFYNGGPMSRPLMQTRWDDMKAQVQPLIQAVFNQNLNESNWNSWADRDATLLAQCRTLGLWPSTLAPGMTPFGGSVSSITLSNPNASGTLYYTIDGRDPRAVGGNAQGSIYTAPLAVNGPITLKARVRSTSGVWSPIVEADFAPTVLPKVVVSEIHYNPTGDGDATEFLELLNVGSTPASLMGAHFTDGITYTFGNVTLAPGETFVIVKDKLAFNTQYDPDVNDDRVFTGALDNKGETLTLCDIAEQVILSFTYGDSNTVGWPTTPDGGGDSLVLRNPFSTTVIDPAQAANWRASGSLGGAPGVADSTVFTGTPLADLDHDGYCALIEYALGTSDTQAASKPSITCALDGTDFTLNFTHPAAADDVTIEAIQSTTLAPGTWSPASFLSETRESPGILRTTWRTPAADPRVFLRLRVSQRP